jgi:hypothetical protein
MALPLETEVIIDPDRKETNAPETAARVVQRYRYAEIDEFHSSQPSASTSSQQKSIVG